MAGQTTCASCGEPVTQDFWDEASERLTPCAKCGSTARNYSLKAEPGLYYLSGSDVKFDVVRNTEILLQSAQRLFDSGEYSVAVVVAHTACEVGVERIIAQCFARSNIPQAAEPVNDLLNGYNVKNPRVSKLFNALTGKKVAEDTKTIWEKFGESVKRRNSAVHAGKQPTRDEAQESLTVVGEMVQYLVGLIQ